MGTTKILLFAALVLPMGTSLETRGFERVAEREGVVAYQHVDAHVVRVAAEGEFEAPPDVVRDALLDYPMQVRRLDRLAEARVLERGVASLYVYQRLDLPVIDDRDYNLLIRWGKDGDVLWVTHNAVDRVGPAPRPGVIRVTEHSGSWRLSPIRGGKATLARFETTIDLSGRVPRWLARSATARDLPEMFQHMRELAVHTVVAGRRS